MAVSAKLRLKQFFLFFWGANEEVMISWFPQLRLKHETKGRCGLKKYIVVQERDPQYPVLFTTFMKMRQRPVDAGAATRKRNCRWPGDRFQCPAHGSEFQQQGEVQNGPADSKLRSFPIVIENNRLRILLKVKEITNPVRWSAVFHANAGTDRPGLTGNGYRKIH